MNYIQILVNYNCGVIEPFPEIFEGIGGVAAMTAPRVVGEDASGVFAIAFPADNYFDVHAVDGVDFFS